MSKHRDNTVAQDLPQVFVAGDHTDQVVAVEADTNDLVHLSITPAAALELARVLVQYGSATRHGHVTPTGSYDPGLWHDVGLSLNSAALRVETAPVSRYIAPRPPHAAGRRRRTDAAPLTVVRADR